MQDTIYGHSRQRNRVADKKSLGSIKHIYSYLPCVVLCIAKRWHKGLKLLDFFFSFFLFLLLFLCKSCHFLVLASPCHFNLPTEKDKCRKLGIYHSMTENQRSKATPCWNDKKKKSPRKRNCDERITETFQNMWIICSEMEISNLWGVTASCHSTGNLHSPPSS